jgi:hypothetical protein
MGDGLVKKKTILLILVLIFLLSACTNGSSDNGGDTSLPKEVQDSTPLSKDTIVELDDFSFQVSNYYLVKSENDAVKDAINVGEKISNATFDSTKLGFDIGFNSSKPEISNRDSYNPYKKIKSQSDSIIPKMDIQASDNEGDDLILLHNSIDGKYIQVDNPIGVFVFKIFGDTETVDFMFDGNAYELELK